MKANIINSYQKLPIGKYNEICEISKSDAEEIDKQVAIIAILTGMTEEDVLQMPIAEYAQLSTQIGFLAKAPETTGRIADVYKMAGWELIPTTDFRDVTTAQYIDFQTFIKKNDMVSVEIVSCFLVPKGHKYSTDYDVMAVQKAIRENMSVHDVLSIVDFFFTRFRESIASSLSSSESELKKMKKRHPRREEMMVTIQALKTLLGQNGDGLRRLT